MNEHILIVADESTQTQGLLQGLRGLALPAHLLPTGRAAMAFLKDRRPAVVVLDKALPDLSGLNLCRVIKADERTRSTFILVLLDDLRLVRFMFHQTEDRKDDRVHLRMKC